MDETTLKTVGLIGAGLLVGYLVAKVRKQHRVALETVADIEGQLAALDPATRAGVIARLSRDSIEFAKGTVDAVRERNG